MIKIPYFDKMVHFGMFFVMGIFVCSELKIQTKLSNLWITIITLGIVAFYGGTIEILQHSYFYNRSGDFKDFVADVIGGIVAILLFPWLKKQKDLLLNRKPFNRISFLKKIL
jgi:VanZ family protein